MTPTAWIIAVAAIVVIGLVIVATGWSRRRRSAELKGGSRSSTSVLSIRTKGAGS